MRVRKSLPQIAALLIGCGLPEAMAQTLYNNGATITVKSGGTLTVKGALTNVAGSTITNSGVVGISGNTVNNGTISTPAPSALVFEGTAAQTLSGSSPVNAGDVSVNNAAGVTLSTILNVAGVMTFTNGIVVAAGSTTPLVFGSTASVGGTPSDASHVNGYVRKLGTGAFTFPIGDGLKYQPVGVNLSANGSGMTARYVAADAGFAPFGTRGSSATPLLYRNGAEYWDLVQVSTATGSVTVYFDGYNNRGISSIADLRVAHKTGGEWLNEGGTATGTTASGSITSASLSSFSPFTLGSISAASPLPLTLLDFTGWTEDGVNRLEWATSAESLGSGFDLERSSNGVSFSLIARIAGTGDNSSYTYLDEAAPAGTSFYRLKIVKVDGIAGYSRIVTLRNGGVVENNLTMYPTPVSEELSMLCKEDRLLGRDAQVIDGRGQVIVSVKLQAVTHIDVRSWSAGIYILRLPDGSAMKIVKQ